MEHRAGWDATFSAPKSVSLTALVGGDERVREAHQASVRVALRELEAYTQASLGGNAAPETTGCWIAATFEPCWPASSLRSAGLSRSAATRAAAASAGVRLVCAAAHPTAR